MTVTALLQPLLEGTAMAPPKDIRRRAADAEDIINERLRRGAPPEDPLVEADMRNSLSRMVDMRIPLWGILGATGTLAMVLITMWFNVQALTAGMAEMRTLMRESVTTAQANDREITRLMARQQQSEETIRDMRLRLDNLHTQLNAMSRPYFQQQPKEQR
jgi:hypothetical protein